MTKRRSRLIALLMIIFAMGFICCALGHPERAWPWPNWITNIIYFIYMAFAIIFLNAPFENGKLLFNKICVDVVTGFFGCCKRIAGVGSSVILNYEVLDDGLLGSLDPAAGGNGFAIQGDLGGGSEPLFTPVQGGDGFAFRSCREQGHL